MSDGFVALAVSLEEASAAGSPVARASRRRLPTEEAPWVRRLLIGLAVGFLALFLLLPLITVFMEAFRKGGDAFLQAFADPAAVDAILLTLMVAAIAVPANLVFGIAAAWAPAKLGFRGTAFLVTLTVLLFSVSPVVAALGSVLLSASHRLFGGLVQSTGIQIIFALPGIIMATIFVTFPFIARELIPLMEELGNADEEAALTLGASGFRMFWTVTLPNVKWALLYGVLLCNARAMGEFGAVSVVSGHIRGYTNTMPLHIEILYNEYQFVAAFAVASLLAALALVTLGIKSWLEHRYAGDLAAGHRH